MAQGATRRAESQLYLVSTSDEKEVKRRPPGNEKKVLDLLIREVIDAATLKSEASEAFNAAIDRGLMTPPCGVEQGDHAVFHELRGDGPAPHAGKLLLDEPDILRRLHNADLVLADFRLHGDDVMAPVRVQTDLQLVDFDLADALESTHPAIPTVADCVVG
jgi:hypothetical protein